MTSSSSCARYSANIGSQAPKKSAEPNLISKIRKVIVFPKYLDHISVLKLCQNSVKPDPKSSILRKWVIMKKVK